MILVASPARLTFEKRVFTLQTLNIKEYSNLKSDDVHRVLYKGLGSKRSPLKILNTLIAPFVFRVVNIFYLLAGICQCIHFRCGLTLSKCPFSSFTQRSRRIKNSARFQGFTLGKWEGPRGSSKLDYYPPGHKDFPRCQSAQV